MVPPCLVGLRRPTHIAGGSKQRCDRLPHNGGRPERTTRTWPAPSALSPVGSRANFGGSLPAGLPVHGPASLGAIPRLLLSFVAFRFCKQVHYTRLARIVKCYLPKTAQKLTCPNMCASVCVPVPTAWVCLAKIPGEPSAEEIDGSGADCHSGCPPAQPQGL